MLRINSGWKSSSWSSNSALRKWSGNDAGDVLQVLTAQAVKLEVRTFIFFFSLAVGYVSYYCSLVWNLTFVL